MAEAVAVVAETEVEEVVVEAAEAMAVVAEVAGSPAPFALSLSIRISGNILRENVRGCFVA